MNNSIIEKLASLIKRSTYTGGLEQQIHVIVDGVSELLSVDVCSVYRLDKGNDLALVASHGLANRHPVIVPKGSGLVGRVLESGETLNIVNPQDEPDFYFVAQSSEERLKSFCGVPLIHHAKVIGVLVVQSLEAECVDAESEALLVTLASHLAILIAQTPMVSRVNNDSVSCYGISGAPGIAMGTAVLRRSASLRQVQAQESENGELEQQAWASLKEATLLDLAREREQLSSAMGESLAGVLDAYQQLLRDQSFSERIEQAIKQGSALPWAIKQAVNYFSEQFLAIDDAYLRARHEDIEHLGDKLYDVWQKQTMPVSADGFPPSSGDSTAISQDAIILCGETVSVSDIIRLTPGSLKGIVCSDGGALSHVAVLANALGIPAIMGLGKLPVHAGDQLIVDGDRAELLINPRQSVVKAFQRLMEEQNAFGRDALEDCHRIAKTQDGQTVTILANSGLQADIFPGLKMGADGVGLYRTELPFMLHNSLPTEDEQYHTYRQVIEAYQGKPVCFRLLDVGGDKPLTYMPVQHEENPALGLRGIRYLLDNVLILSSQLRAILRAAKGAEQVEIMIPMVTSSQELDQCLDLLNNTVREMLDAGESITRPRIGIMVEVPAAVSMLPLWKQRIDFISIGSNDLSQYLLATDRNNALVSANYDRMHPAIFHEIYRIVNVARQCGLPVSLCGELASDPLAFVYLIGMGVRRFSMSAARIPTMKWLVQQLDSTDMERLLHQALEQDNAEDIREISKQALRALPEYSPYLLGH